MDSRWSDIHTSSLPLRICLVVNDACLAFRRSMRSRNADIWWWIDPLCLARIHILTVDSFFSSVNHSEEKMFSSDNKSICSLMKTTTTKKKVKSRQPIVLERNHRALRTVLETPFSWDYRIHLGWSEQFCCSMKWNWTMTKMDEGRLAASVHNHPLCSMAFASVQWAGKPCQRSAMKPLI